MRREQILAAAGSVFAEAGYDDVTVTMIAARAGVATGSLYQFFADKEAIALAYATTATARLQEVYDVVLAPEIIGLPMATFLDHLIDRLVAFNDEYPGYFALSLATRLSPSLETALSELRVGIDSRMDALYAALLPNADADQRRIAGLISYRLFLSVLPIILAADRAVRAALIREMKVMLYRYLEPIAGTRS